MSFGTIIWENFTSANTDGRGNRLRFEDLCRQLFTNEFLAQNKKTKYVHSNPNNAGLESDPVYDEQNQRWIGYQAKFFDDRPGYERFDYLYLEDTLPENIQACADISGNMRVFMEDARCQPIYWKLKRFTFPRQKNTFKK